MRACKPNGARRSSATNSNRRQCNIYQRERILPVFAMASCNERLSYQFESSIFDERCGETSQAKNNFIEKVQIYIRILASDNFLKDIEGRSVCQQPVRLNFK